MEIRTFTPLLKQENTELGMKYSLGVVTEKGHEGVLAFRLEVYDESGEVVTIRETPPSKAHAASLKAYADQIIDLQRSKPMKTVTQEQFYEVINDLDATVRPSGGYPYDVAFTDRTTRQLVGRIVYTEEGGKTYAEYRLAEGAEKLPKVR